MLFTERVIVWDMSLYMDKAKVKINLSECLIEHHFLKM
jgi:hypothetical protein